jgi:spore coat protein CotF
MEVYIMNTYKNANSRLTSVEIASLWNSYIFECMVHHIFSYFVNNSKDEEIKSYIEYVQVSSSLHLHNYMAVFKKENLPIPRGTTSEDVNINAPRLFSDAFYITYIKSMAKFALTNFAMSYSECSRPDMRMLFKEHLDRLEDVDRLATEIMQSKGIYVIPPCVEIPEDVDFIDNKKKFFAGFFTEKRPLSVLELRQLFTNLHSNALGEALMKGFSRVVSSKEVYNYILKGKELSSKYLKMFSDIFSDESLDIPPTYDNEVILLSPKDSPFSDRLILNHAVLLNAYGIGNYALGMAQSQRRDLSAMYGRIMLEVGMYTDSGADILIRNQWLEQPPLIYNKQMAPHH